MSGYRFFILQILLLLPLCIHAEERSVEQARDMAYEFMESRLMTRSSSLELRLVYDGEEALTRSMASPAYYVFNNEAGPGFIIISAEDSSIPVLGYSPSFNFRSEGIPANLRWWLNTMRSQINDLRCLDAPALKASADLGEDVVRYETALWDQADPYYNACPFYNGKRCVTGCGPTAIAIAMRAREWPDAGVGKIPSYKTESYGLTVSSRTLGTAYDWNDMPLTDGAYVNWTSAQREQVSRLIADIGAATNADYGPEATSIYDDSVPLALSQYMKYDKSIYTAWREAYSSSEWYPLIRSAVDDGPVIYSGADDVAGHMFVLDGYTDKDYFHVNWGWGGVANGYYLLTALTPEDQGIGSNELGSYNQYQAAVIGMKKDEGGSAAEMIRFYTEGDGYNGVVGTVTEFKTGNTYTIRSGYYANYGTETYDGTIRLVVVGGDGQVRYVVYEEDLVLDSFYLAYYNNIRITFESIQPGDMLIAQFYDNVSGEWKMVRGNTDEGVIESVKLAEDSIEGTTALKYSYATRSFSLKTKAGVTVECRSEAGDEVVVKKDQDGNYTVSLEGCPAGIYHLDLSSGSEFKRLVINL